jgi:hypothetical protein
MKSRGQPISYTSMFYEKMMVTDDVGVDSASLGLNGS